MASAVLTHHRGRAAIRLRAGDLDVHVLPGLGMLCASFTRGGVEILGRTEELDGYVDKGSTVGIPLLYPWANRLSGFRYSAAGRTVDLDPGSPLLHLDGRGLPMHGVPGAKLRWSVHHEAADGAHAVLPARLAWSRAERLALFPYPHSVELALTLDARVLEIATEVHADGGVAVPVSFGFHPYLRLDGVARRDWQLELPALRRLAIDARQIPTGEESDFEWPTGPLGATAFDDPFRVLAERPRFSLSARGRGVAVEFLSGYPFAQVYAPAERDFVAIEPMTAPGNALVNGRDLPVVEPGGSYRAAFRIDVWD